MSTHEAARAYKQNMDRLHSGAITPDAFRAANRALKAEVGEAVHADAKWLAIVASNR